MTVRSAFFSNENFHAFNDPSLKLSDAIKDKIESYSTVAIISRIAAICSMNESFLTYSEFYPDTIIGSSGNPTEVALLKFISDLGFDYSDIRNKTRGRSEVSNLSKYLKEGKSLDFTSARKMMSWVIPIYDAEDNDASKIGYVMYSKGGAEEILQRCTKIRINDQVHLIQSTQRTEILGVMHQYARRGMRCLALAYRDDISPSTNLDELHSTIENSDGSKAWSVESELIFVALIGMEDPLRPEVPDAIEKCYRAGIDVRMVTGDSPNTAVSIAYQAGILKPYHFVDASSEKVASELKPNVLMEGKTFRSKVYRSTIDSNGVEKREFDQPSFDMIWPYLRVLARSSPDDKLTLAHGLNQSMLFENEAAVRDLKENHNIDIFPDRQVVAMTGDGTNDAPALKRADIGFAMGISGTQIAKDAADIILLDDNFASIVTAAKWGRNIYAGIQKFMTFQLTINVSAVFVALVGSFVYQQSPLAVIHLLWVNLMQDSLASLALASEPPVDDVLNRPPVNRSDSILTKRMIYNILGQGLYQNTVMMILLFAGPALLDVDKGDDEESDGDVSEHYTIIFNAYVWMSLFNQINCRKVEGEKNVFIGIFRNPLFIAVWSIEAVLQGLIVQFGGRAFHVKPLKWTEWVLCMILGVISIPVQQLINIYYNVAEQLT